MTALTAAPSWRALAAHHAQIKDVHLRTLFADDPDRASRFSAEGGGVLQSVATPQRSPGAKLRAAARQGGGLRFHTGRPLVGRLKAAWRSNGAPIAGVGAQGQEPALDREL